MADSAVSVSPVAWVLTSHEHAVIIAVMRPLFPAAMLVAVALLASAAPARAASWNHVYTPTALPENYAPGPWVRDGYRNAGALVALTGGKLCLELNDDREVLWYRDTAMDPALASAELTLEWSSDVASAGEWDLYAGNVALSYYEARTAAGAIDYQYLMFDGVSLDPALGTGSHVYRIVRSAAETQLWVDGSLTAATGQAPGTADWVEIFFWGYSSDPAPVRSCTTHLAYSTGAFTPTQLPSPGGGDTTAPSATADLRAVSASTNSISLAWTAPGDDANAGTATSYDVRFTTAGPIADEALFNAATRAIGAPSPQIAGSAESFTVLGLAPGTTYYFALKTADPAGNVSALSNSPQGVTTGAELALSISTGSNQAGTITKTTRIPLTVKVVDAQGMAVAGATVTFSTSAAPSGAAGHGLSIVSTTTAQDGTAATILTFGDHVGTYTVTAMCEGCAPGAVTFNALATLFFRLESDVAVIQPVAFDQVVRVGNKVRLTVTAYGVGGTTDTVANYPLGVISEAMPHSGGHDHAAGRPDGKFSGGAGVSVYESSATGRSDSNGQLFVVFTSTFFSGTNEFLAGSTLDVNAATVTARVAIRAGNFDLLPDATYYIKDGGTCEHHGPDGSAGCISADRNHYGAASTNEAISTVAAKWLAFAGATRILEINDMSLQTGGGFDVGGNWTSDIVDLFPANKKRCNTVGHCEHRGGREVDIQVRPNLSPGSPSLTQKQQQKLRDIILNRRGKIHPEGDHWHVRF